MNVSLTKHETQGPPALQQRFDRYYRDYYNEEASEYDKVRFGSSNGSNVSKKSDEGDVSASEWAEQAVIYNLLGLSAGQSVLDVPAGTGRIAAYLGERGLRVTALDLTENMLLEAQRRAHEAGLEEMSCVQGNARQLPFESETFDGLICNRFFHLLPVFLHRPFLLDMWRVVRPGGVLLVQFRSALTGGGLVWLHELLRRYRQGRKPRYYLWPHQMNALFDQIGGMEDIESLSLHGISPPGVRFIRGRFPQAATTLEEITRDGSHTFLTHRRIFVRVVKRKA
ncbi:MAG: class I SAM-dependent methyltransferase [Ardenticatenaceae bacterium]